MEALLDDLTAGWTVEKEISLDSTHFFRVSDLMNKARERNFNFYLDGKEYSLHNFKQWVDIPNLPKKLFISYSSKNAAFMLRLATHLEVLRRNGLIVPWFDRQISPGTRWDDAIKTEMEAADIIVFLLSPDFLATDYIRTVEIPLAIRRARQSDCLLFPIEVQPCSWEETEISQFQQNLKPGIPGKETIIITHPENDSEWKLIIRKLKEVVAAE